MRNAISVTAIAVSIPLLTAIGASAQTTGSVSPYTTKMASETVFKGGMTKSSTETTGIANDGMAKAAMDKDGMPIQQPKTDRETKAILPSNNTRQHPWSYQ